MSSDITGLAGADVKTLSRSALGADRRRRSCDLNQSEPQGSTMPTPWRSPFHDSTVDPRFLLTIAVKFADLNHATKPWPQHQEWSQRITDEFWTLGDKERKLGVPISPLCDRENDKDIARSQIGFFQFVCNPFYELVADLVEPEMKPYKQLQANFSGWKGITATETTAAEEEAPR